MVNGLTTPSSIHLSRMWFNSSAVHGIAGGSSNTFQSDLFLYSPTDVVMAWDAVILFVLIVCAILLVLCSRSADCVMHRFSRLSL